MYKQILYVVLLSGLIFITTNCTDNYEEYNTKPYEATKEQMSYDAYNIRAAIIGMQGYIIPTNGSFQYTECLLGGSFGGYLADSNQGFYGKNYATYNPQQQWIKTAFNDIIPNVYKNFTQLKQVSDDSTFLAIGNIIKVASIHRVTDIYGHIPYSKIGEDGKLATGYDTQEEVYNLMFEELDHAINILTPLRTSTFEANADNIFNGNIEKWVRYANSLKLRLAMHIVYANESLAKQKAEEVIKNVVGPMLSNDDCAFNNGVSKSMFKQVMYDFNGGDSRISADLTSYMNGYNDPRRGKYFTKSNFTNDEIGPLENGYYGLRSGIQLPSSELCQKYANMNVSADETKLLLMNAAETAFLRAEGAIRGWNMGETAENLYNEGIRLSFQQWNSQGVANYINDNTSRPNVYLDPINEANNGTDASTITIKWEDSADMEQKLERIITQKWIANFPLGLESWTEFRRTGYPKLMEVLSNLSNGIVDSKRMARRLPYPQSEYTENTENLQEAISKLGGPDNMATSVWWDVK